ncbi:MMPL family transporter [Wenjunlia tyrosinilytica]|uniref:Membrane protein ActII-3 n=1 Tax=Wenjunlia tyrosinilytica TaxID=1544741 RepID=A0A918DTW4_9ACTN|nr:MMPL family transporter [Wenjunlia tyrosinilytica]GGO82258.1 putative membrane protein ActII-3 [Wenjunlia tyrosinilytica]
MSPQLNGVGRVATLVCGRRSKWIVLVLWIVLIVAAAPAAAKLTDAQNNEASSWLPGSAESTKVVELTKQFRPDTVPAVVLYARDSGLTAADRAKIAADVAELHTLRSHGTQGAKVRGPFFDRARNPRAATVLVPVVIGTNGWNDLAKAVDDMRAITGKGGPPGLQTHITGPAGTAADQADAFAGIDGTLLYSALTVVIIILLFTYRSPTLLLVPVLSVIGALLSAQAVIYLLARHADLVVNAQSAGILTVLVFGAGTDYALLLVARYREELRRHEDRHEAMALALHRAGPAIIASAATVALSMLVLLVADMNSTSGLGPVAAVGITVGLIAMITLFPALLVICGRWVFWPVIPHVGSPEPTKTGVWARIGRRIARRPRTVWVTTAVILAALACGLTTLKADGLSNADSFTGTPDSIVGQRVLAKYFPAGSGEPLVVIANVGKARQVGEAVARDPGVVPDSVGPAPGQPPVKNGRVYLEATMKNPSDSSAAEHTVERVRDAVHPIPGADAKVGGDTAVRLDADRAAARDRNLIIPLILVVVLIILSVLLRALVAPLVLIGTVVLSFAAALGISALAFRHVFHFAGEDTSFPLFVFVFLVALGIDYSIFLMTRVREETATVGTREGTLIALAATGGVISSAGLVLAGTFAALATLPIVAFTELGFAVALGVLLDTFVVRSVLVCAISLDVGPRMWWPSHHDPESSGKAKAPADAPGG